MCPRSESERTFGHPVMLGLYALTVMGFLIPLLLRMRAERRVDALFQREARLTQAIDHAVPPPEEAEGGLQ